MRAAEIQKKDRDGFTLEEDWDIIISPKRRLFSLNLREVWQYRDLLLLFVRRDFVALYKQTILGPLWFIIQPVFTTIIFTIIFGNLAGISTDGIPPMLFYLAGITLWNYFADTLKATSETFNKNQDIFGKVYFPRLIVPLSLSITGFLKLGIQLALFLAIYFYFLFSGAEISPNRALLIFPVLLLILAGLGLGFGLIITSLTTKYRDLKFLVQFGIQLAMYATPVIYPLSEVPENYQWIAVLNPMTAVIETFKYSTLGVGVFNLGHLGYSIVFMIGVLLSGTMIFNKTEQNFMDTV